MKHFEQKALQYAFKQYSDVTDDSATIDNGVDYRSTSCNSYYNGFVEGYKEAVKWISVDDRLPERTGDYLVRFPPIEGIYSYDIIRYVAEGSFESEDLLEPVGWKALFPEDVLFWREIESDNEKIKS